MADPDELARLLLDVQTQLAYQEDTISSLNEALAEQQQEILVLRRQLELLKQRQDDQQAQQYPSNPEAEEKPPHY